MAVLLAWMSWRERELEESSWAAMRDRAVKRSRYPGIERSGLGWRVYGAPTRRAESPVQSIADGSMLLLDRAAETDAGSAPDSAQRLLDGTPSVAIRVDPRTARLSLFRDPLGQRALVYALIPGGVVVASGEHLLRAHPKVSADFDTDYLAAYFTALPPAHQATVYREIRNVPAGAQIDLSASGERLQQSAISHDPSWQGHSDGQLIDRFGELLGNAVARACVGAEQIGLSLSAGIDSSAVAAALPLPGAALAVTYSFAQWPQIDERALVEASSRHLGLPQRSFDADGLQPLLPSLHRPSNPDTPIASIYREIKEGAYREFAQAGTDVWLDGGYGDHLSAPADDWLYAAWRNSRWAALRAEAAYRWGSPGHWGRDRGLRRVARRTLRLAPAAPAALERLRPELRERVEARWRSELESYSHFPRPAQAMTCLNAYAMAAASGEQYYAQRHGMQQRSPFRDLQLTRWMLGLPDDLFLRCGEHKWLLRQWLSQRLPTAIYSRPKSSDLSPFLRQAVAEEREHWLALALSAQEPAASVLTPAALQAATQGTQLLPLWLASSFGLWMGERGD